MRSDQRNRTCPAFVVSRADVMVRCATPDDAAAVLPWRNDPVSRAMSATTHVISSYDHAAWFAAVLADPARHLLIGTASSDPGLSVGVVRFDRLDQVPLARPGHSSYEISFAVAPAMRGMGVAVPLLRCAATWLRGRDSDAVVVARTRVDNLAARRTLARVGYVERSQADGWVDLVAQRS